jgi:hypothetical protein
MFGDRAAVALVGQIPVFKQKARMGLLQQLRD